MVNTMAGFKLISAVLCLLFFCEAIQAQKKKTGSYTNLAGRTGTVEAEYKIEDGDTLFHGDFKFIIKQDLKEGHRFIKETYLGNYENGLKEDKWEYDQLDLRYSVEDIENEKIQMIYWGKKEITDALYDQGIPDGLWSYAYYHIDSSANQEIERVGSIHFKNGKPFGEFIFKSLTSPKYQLDGKFDSLGRLDGFWNLEYNIDTSKIQEIRNYDDGFLLSLERRHAITGELFDSLVYQEVINKLENGTVTKAEGNFDILFDDGFLLESPYLTKQIEGNKLLKSAYNSFLWADLGRGALEGSRHDFNPGTGRFEYDLPESFLQNLEKMRKNLQKIIDRSDDMLDNPKFYINFHQSDLLSKSEAILRYERKKASGILELVNSREDSLYKHIDRDVYFADIYQKYIEPVDTISYQFDGEKKKVALHEHTEKDLAPFYKLEDAIALLNQRSEKAMVDVKQEFEKILQQQRLTALEQDIQFTWRKVKDVYIEKEQSLASKTYSSVIKTWHANIMQQYAGIPDLDKREMEGRFILGVLEELRELKPEIDSIENRVVKIDSAYTEFVFDPYTYSENIRKRLKKRLYETVAEDYYNVLIKEMLEEKHAENLKRHIMKIENLQKKLLKLSEKNTRSLEKKLKKNSDRETIVKLLDLEE